MSLTTNQVENIRQLYHKAERNQKETALILDGIRECTRSVRRLYRILKNCTVAGEKQHILSSLSVIKGFRTRFRSLQVTGGNYAKITRTKNDRIKWEEEKTAFQSRVRSGVIVNIKHIDPKTFIKDCEVLFTRRIQNVLKEHPFLKVNFVFCGEFEILNHEKIINDLKYFTTKNAPIDKNSNLREWFKEHAVDPVMGNFEDFQEQSSGWSLKRIINLVVNINVHNPMKASSYIELPKEILLKKACVNVQNSDSACFAWAITSALYPAAPGIGHRVSSYPHYADVLNLKGITFPMTIHQIPKFEQLNDVSVNVYILEKTSKNSFKTLPTFLTKKVREKHVNLLMVQDSYESDNKPKKYHFVWIKNLSRLISSQLSKHKHKKYICDRCLHYFYTKKALEMHVIDCQIINDCKIKLPNEEKKTLQFKDYFMKEKVPFVIYADTECLLLPTDEHVKQKTGAYQNHIPYSIGYYVKCSYDDTLSFYKSYTGPDCMKWFSNELKTFAENLETVFLCPMPMESLTLKQTKQYKKASLCHICEKPFSETDKKVRDHCHFTGKYRGPAHANCNLQFQDSRVVPVIFHNLSSYDGHLIIKSIAQEIDGSINLLPVNKEKYISFTKNISGNLIKFRFLDSFRFMADSLDSLASSLNSYPILRSEFKYLNNEMFKLVTKKGFYPYDYMKSWDVLNENKLPSREKFFNQLENCHISEHNYEHATKVWEMFKCESIQQYSDLYLKTDVLLLADVFEQFRTSSLKTYGLDPAHAYTLPGYAWQCMSFITKIQLELLTDIDMVMFIERGIRGGLTQCTKRYSKANNKYLPDYNPERESTYLMYFDVNNQYGWAMSQNLPYGGFEWVSEENLNNFNVHGISDDSKKGYVLEVDISIPENLHDWLADLPPCPEHICPPNTKQPKLMATLNSKVRYVIHYRNLKQALNLGVKLEKIHRILSFNQSPWLKPYIDLNTKLRQNAKNDFEKNLFKLMNNAVFGKTMENVRKHSIVKLVTKWEGRYQAEALISRPEFKNSLIIDENLVLIELNKTEIYINKPIYVGMCVLDIAKTTIYDFHYNYMKKKFGENCTILYGDTDSLIYEIRSNDIYAAIKTDCYTHFDTSDYPEDNIYNIPRVNKKVIGKMKDENNSKVLYEFAGLRSKMYSTRVYIGDKNYMDNKFNVAKKIKGIKKSVVQQMITFDDYVNCLNNSSTKCVSQNLIQAKNHNISTIKQNKVALNPHDDKRYLINNSFETLPWGHYSIMDIQYKTPIDI